MSGTKRKIKYEWILVIALLAMLIVSCKEETVTIPEGFGPIDIPSPGFFWLVQPWKDGKLMTIDGWGRFAEIIFMGPDKIRLNQLFNFPRTSLDRTLLTWPEAGLIAGTSGKVHHIIAVDEQKTKSHVPLLSWVHLESPPVLLDAGEGLVGYKYASQRSNDDVRRKLFVYNYKEDRMVYESPEEGFVIGISIVINDQFALSFQGSFNGNHKEFKYIFYNWRTEEIVENDLTKAINSNRIDLIINPLRNIHPARRYLFGYSRILNKRLKITWDEEYSDIKIILLDYLLPKGKRLDDFILSADGTWGTSLVKGYQGLYNEMLCKRAFFHLDDRYPNGISMPVITEDYEDSPWDYSAFVEHPVHGLCFAQEWHKNENEKDQLYLRLYRMDSVLDEINKGLLEAAQAISKR